MRSRGRPLLRMAVRSGDAARLRALAACVDDGACLVAPIVGCLVPLPRGGLDGGFSALWADAQRMVLCSRKGPEDVDAWLAALVCVVRRRSRMPVSYARSLRCPSGALARALDAAAWYPGDAATKAWHALQTRTVAVLLVADVTASPTLREDAWRWVTGRCQAHGTRAVAALLAATREAVDHTRVGGPRGAPTVRGLEGLDPSLGFFSEDEERQGVLSGIVDEPRTNLGGPNCHPYENA